MSGKITPMAKEKISATVDPARLAEAKALRSNDSVSAVLDEALRVLIEREHERRWLDAHPVADSGDRSNVVDQVIPDLTGLDWDD